MTTTPALVASASREQAWAKALYDGWAKYGATPIFDAVCAELGNPLAVSRLAS